MAASEAHILVVDDNPHNLTLAEAELEYAGYRVTCAATGEEALLMARESAPDLILLDVLLPVLDGIEVCKRLKADPATETIPVVMLTSLTEKTHKIRALEVGADDFLTRPFDRAELLARVRAEIRLKRLYEWVDRANTELAVQSERAAADARLRGVVDIAPDAVISVDDQYRIVRFNRGAEEIFGYSADELIGQPVDVLIPQRYLLAHHEHVRSFAESPDTMRRMGVREIAALRKDGSEFPAEASVSKLNQNGHVVFTVILRDVSERVRLISALKDREEQLQALVHRLLGAQEEERRRVAYDVHDGLAQMAVGLQQVLEAYASRHRPRGADARAALDRTVELAQHLVQDVPADRGTPADGPRRLRAGRSDPGRGRRSSK